MVETDNVSSATLQPEPFQSQNEIQRSISRGGNTPTTEFLPGSSNRSNPVIGHEYSPGTSHPFSLEQGHTSFGEEPPFAQNLAEDQQFFAGSMYQGQLTPREPPPQPPLFVEDEDEDEDDDYNKFSLEPYSPPYHENIPMKSFDPGRANYPLHDASYEQNHITPVNYLQQNYLSREEKCSFPHFRDLNVIDWTENDTNDEFVPITKGSIEHFQNLPPRNAPAPMNFGSGFEESPPFSPKPQSYDQQPVSPYPESPTLPVYAPFQSDCDWMVERNNMYQQDIPSEAPRTLQQSRRVASVVLTKPVDLVSTNSADAESYRARSESAHSDEAHSDRGNMKATPEIPAPEKNHGTLKPTVVQSAVETQTDEHWFRDFSTQTDEICSPISSKQPCVDASCQTEPAHEPQNKPEQPITHAAEIIDSKNPVNDSSTATEGRLSPNKELPDVIPQQNFVFDAEPTIPEQTQATVATDKIPDMYESMPKTHRARLDGSLITFEEEITPPQISENAIVAINDSQITLVHGLLKCEAEHIVEHAIVDTVVEEPVDAQRQLVITTSMAPNVSLQPHFQAVNDRQMTLVHQGSYYGGGNTVDTVVEEPVDAQRQLVISTSDAAIRMDAAAKYLASFTADPYPPVQSLDTTQSKQNERSKKRKHREVNGVSCLTDGTVPAVGDDEVSSNEHQNAFTGKEIQSKASSTKENYVTITECSQQQMVPFTYTPTNEEGFSTQGPAYDNIAKKKVKEAEDQQRGGNMFGQATTCLGDDRITIISEELHSSVKRHQKEPAYDQGEVHTDTGVCFCDRCV